MTRNVVTIAPQATLASAAEVMRRLHVSGLPVVDPDERLVGILSEKDVLADLDRAAGIGRVRGILDLLLEARGKIDVSRLDQSLRRLESGKVEEAMTRKVVTIDADASLGEAARVLRQFSVSRLPVMEGERLVGILTHQNIVESIAA